MIHRIPDRHFFTVKNRLEEAVKRNVENLARHKQTHTHVHTRIRTYYIPKKKKRKEKGRKESRKKWLQEYFSTAPRNLASYIRWTWINIENASTLQLWGETFKKEEFDLQTVGRLGKNNFPNSLKIRCKSVVGSRVKIGGKNLMIFAD